MTIELQMDFTPDLAEGPSVDAENDNPVGITKVFTCGSGPSVGTFSMLFFPEIGPAVPGDESGAWSVTTGTVESGP